jgi:hypothetical protein
VQPPKLVTANLFFRVEGGPRGLFCHVDVTDQAAAEALISMPAESERGPTPFGFPTPFEIGINTVRLGLAHVFRCRFLRDEMVPNFNPRAHVCRLEAMELRLVLRFSEGTQSQEIHLDRLWAMSGRLKGKFFQPIARRGRDQATFDRDNWTDFAGVLETDLADFLTPFVKQAVLIDRGPQHPVRFEPVGFSRWDAVLSTLDEAEAA